MRAGKLSRSAVTWMPSLGAAGQASTVTPVGTTKVFGGLALINNHELIDVFIGVDVGKTDHHAVALNREGKKLLDKALPQDEAKLKEIIRSLAKHGRALFVVDQPATIGALPVAVAQAEGILVGYLPGLAMRRIADLHPGEAKTEVLTELPKPVRDIHRRGWWASTRFCSHGQPRECPTGSSPAGGAPVRGACGYRRTLRALPAG